MAIRDAAATLTTLAAQVETLTRDLAEAHETAHYANGVAGLAMKHRDYAEEANIALVDANEELKAKLAAAEQRHAALVAEVLEWQEAMRVGAPDAFDVIPRIRGAEAALLAFPLGPTQETT